MKPYPLNTLPDITNFLQLIAHNVKIHLDKAAFQYLEGGTVISVSYSQFERDVDSLSGYLIQNGLQGTHIALLGENSYFWILSYFAVVLAGGVIVPLDKELAEPDIANLLERCDATALICSESYSDVSETMLTQNKITSTINMRHYPTILQSTLNINRPISTDENAVCSIIFTSGTTGRPKGVMLTQRSLMIDTVSASRNVLFTGSSLLTLPLHHTFAFVASVLVLLVYGYPICISRSIRTLMADIQIFQPESISLVPLYVETMYNNIWKTVKSQGKEKPLKALIRVSNPLRKVGIDLRRTLFRSILAQFGGNLGFLISGGAPIKQSYIDGMEALGITVLNGYGITECSPVVAVNRNDRPFCQSR